MIPEQKNEIWRKILLEIKVIVLMTLLILIVLKLAFYKESFWNILKFSFSMIYFSLLPGLVIMLNFSKWLDLPIRIALSFPVGFAVYAIGSYYFNFIIPLDYLLILPGIISFLFIAIYLRNNVNNN